jgi:hypothetical protein
MQIETTNHSERGHHPTSPSSLQTLEASPCFLNKQGETNEAAERGTKQHEAADSGKDDSDLSDEEAYAVAQTVDAVSEAVRSLGGDSAIVIKEKYWRVDDAKVGSWVGTTGGFADVVVLNGEKTAAIVLDWKFGRWSVEPAKTNLQGISYALGVFHEYKSVEEATVAFFSPHLNEWTQHTFTRADIPKLLLRVKVVTARALATRASIGKDPTKLSSYYPTTTACTFCGRIGVCPAVAKLAVEVSKKYQPLNEIPEDIRGFVLLNPAVARYGIQLTGVVASWANEYRRRITEQAIDHPEFIPEGYALTITHPRKVTSVAKAIEVAERHLPKDQVFAMLKLPITVLEKAVGAKAPRGQKAAAIEALSEELETAGAVRESPTPVVSLRMKNEEKKDNDE